MPVLHIANPLSKAKIKFIKSLGSKKARMIENKFVLQGEKHIIQLLQSDYEVTMLVGTPTFLSKHATLLQNKVIETFEATPALLHSLGTLQENTSGLAVAVIPQPTMPRISDYQYGLVLDGISDPGNLGTIIRIADWYDIAAVICSPRSVDLYNPKVLQASMGSFLNIPVYYTPLADYLAIVSLPVIGTFTVGMSLHDAITPRPASGLIVIGNETHGISDELLPYIQHRLSIPRYGKAESLNAAVATAVVCDHLVSYAATHYNLPNNSHI
jgi:TrmH family RNA methyltransferase